MGSGSEVLVLLAQDRTHLAANRLCRRLSAMSKDRVIDLVNGECEVVPRADALVGEVVDAASPSGRIE